ncbi:hypothetical protein M0802_005614 [Mischocyttarus mexicanus]|nr:hypothetical protein M0802_005614 [Mischocyttarus mexicanus]
MYAFKLSIVLVFIFGSVQCSVSSIYDFGRANIVVETDPLHPCSATRECLNCTKSRLCLPINNELQQAAVIDCSSDSSTPYCDSDTGLCTSIAPNGCSSSEFICPFVDGVYPDPRSCTRYHICVDRYRTTNVCPPNNVYDASLKDCKFSRYMFDCVKISCSGREGKFFAYPKDDRIYGSCVDGKPYILGRCENYEQFDVSLGKCKRVCRGPENQPTEDCQKYIRCAETSRGRYEPVLQNCACNKGFDQEKGTCSTEAECIKNITDTCKPKASPTEAANVANSDNQVTDLIINNSENNNSSSNVSNENDDSNGNIVNGNDNGNNSNTGNVGNEEEPSPEVQPLIIINSGDGQKLVTNNNDNANQGNNKKPGLGLLIINNSGNSESDNNVTNGNDNSNGNIVNGNGNDNNSNQGNVGNEEVSRPGIRPRIINNSENNNSDNGVSNGNDSGNGNIINGNGNDNNSNQGNVGNQKRSRSSLSLLIINNSENSNSDNDVSNGNDSGNGNIVNGNGNGGNSNQGNVGNEEKPRPGILSRIINNSQNNNSDNGVSNGNDNGNGNIINGNGNDNNSNHGNVGNQKRSRSHLSLLLINNSENSNSDNDVSNGNDSGNGNIINGNGNGNNSN